MSNTLETTKLASYVAGLNSMGERERSVYARCLHRDTTYAKPSQSDSIPTREEDSEALSRALETLLAAIGEDSVSGRRLAELLMAAVQPGNTEEEALLDELRVLDRVAAPPTRWGKFEILGTLGSGGFGTVYKAWDPDLQQAVALKLYHPNQSTRSKDELLAEARKLVLVDHPNVVDVRSADVHDGRVGLCIELIAGQTLAGIVAAQGRLGPEEAAAIGCTLCQALAAVHRAGLTHGDVKAENVIRESGGRFVLMDFGSARFRDPEAIQDDRISGTPRYMAPELFERAEPTVQSDIYAVGVLLFHLVTGTYPVRASSLFELRRAHQEHEGTVLLRDERPGLPQAFVDAVERALSRDPSRRFQTAGLMAQALASVRPPGVNLATAALAIVTALLGIYVLGFVASSAFRVFLGVPEQFDGGGLSPVWGIRPMVPVVFYWGYLLFVLATLIGFAMVAGAVVNRGSTRAPHERNAAARARRAGATAMAAFVVGSVAWFAVTWSQSTWGLAAMALGIAWAVGVPLLVVAAGSMSAPTLVREMADATAARKLSALIQPAPDSLLRAATIFSLAATCWLLVVWWQAGVFRGLVALTNLPIESTDLRPLLTPLANTNQRYYVQAYAYLSFALAFAIWYVRRVEPAGSFEPVRFMRWSLVLLFVLTLVMTAIPYRITWRDYERVDYGGTPGFIVGETADQYHLFFPPATGALGRSVQRNDARLTHSGTYGKLFVERLGQ